jgi:2-(1,2-epoxy-1,2-dihydrophenyl)acetyl-CoA isomerase
MTNHGKDEVAVQLEFSHSLAVITLNRPQSYNAFNLALGDALVDSLISCDEDRRVRAVLVTGNGPAFCAGGDIRQMMEHVERDGDAGRFLKTLALRLHGAIATISHMPKPVVMAVNGAAAGAGFSLAMAGDVLIAAEGATFTMAYTAIGLPPDGGISFHLPRSLGPKLAFELTCSNRALSAADAHALGIVSRLYPATSFLAQAKEYASALAKGPTEALARAKRLIAMGTENSLETQMEHERQAIAACGRSADFKEGIAAFLAKRSATFQGR